MAGEWIKVRTNLWNDPRVSDMCDQTGVSEATIIGGLYWLWAAADEHTETGLMNGLSVTAIDRKTGISGFGAALLAIGWIEDTPNGVRLTRFEEHNGASAKSRAQTAKRVSKHRSHSDVTPEGEFSNAPTVRGALAREEKRREEKKEPKVKPTVAASDDAAEVFAYWQQKMNHPASRLDAKRLKAITTRLQDGYTVGQICTAIDGCKLDPWSQGANDRRTVFDDIELICRDGPKVDKFIAIAGRGQQTARPANTQGTFDTLKRYVDKNGEN